MTRPRSSSKGKDQTQVCSSRGEHLNHYANEAVDDGDSDDDDDYDDDNKDN